MKFTIHDPKRGRTYDGKRLMESIQRDTYAIPWKDLEVNRNDDNYSNANRQRALAKAITQGSVVMEASEIERILRSL